MSDLIRLTAADLATKLAAGEVSAVEATRAHLDRIAAVDGDVHAFLHVNENAEAIAADIDRRRGAGEQLHELAGEALYFFVGQLDPGEHAEVADKIGSDFRHSDSLVRLERLARLGV